MVSVLHPTLRPLALPAIDGFVLAAHVIEPRRPRGTVVVHGATAVPASYYHAFAEYLAARGLRVLTYDYRGVGGSRPASLRGLPATMTQWAELDARAAQAWAHQRGDDVAVVGHSFGGQLIGLLDDLRGARGALLVGSQLGWYGHWPWRERARLAALWYAAVPAITAVAGYLPGRFGLGVDLPAGVAREWARWCRSRHYLVDHHPAAAARLARWDRPTALYSFTDDTFAPPGAVAALLDRLAGAPLEHRRIAPAEVGLSALGHFGFFRPRAASLWPAAARFLDAALAGEVPAPPAWIETAEIEADLHYGRA
jgi:predicted alpha/beta hydrolase